MGLVQLKCPACGADKLDARTINGAPGYFCSYCGKEFHEEIGIREYEKLEATIKAGLGSVVDEALLREKMEKYYNLRSLLWGKITAKYIDSAAIVGICRDILAIAQHDFLAEFFEVANSGTTEEIAQYISTINEKENAALVDLVLDFIIKSLEEPYITPTAALLDRCGRIFSPEKKQEYLSRFEAEAAKVTDGLYVTSVDRDVFLAYSGKDMPAVVDVLNFIESQGLSCFAAFRNLRHGRDAVANYERALEDAINHCSIFVFVSSVNSRSFACDALKKEMTYIRNTEMANLPTCRSYDQLPEKYRKLRIEYRIDNKPTPIAIEKTVRDFFAGLTYTENYDQLGIRLSECMEKIYNPTFDEEVAPSQPEQTSSSFNLTDKDTLAQMLRMINEENKRAEEEAKRKAEEEAKCKAEEEAKRKAGEEAKRKAGEEAKRKAEEEAKRKAEEDAKRKAEEEAKRKAEEEAKRNVELEKNFTIKNGVLTKLLNTNITEIVIPSSVTSIGNEAFKDCYRLTSITIPSSVTSIGNYAFFFCDSLTSITIPNSVTSIGNKAFSNCKNLTSITIPNSVTSIGNKAFSNCKNLTSITIPSSVTSICDYVFFSCDSLTSITIPSSVTSIGNDAFCNCHSLTSINIPDNVTSIGDHAFSCCNSLTSITIPNSVTSIGDHAFYACKNLTSITIPSSGVTRIGDCAFYECKNLTSITIPSSVISISNSAFEHCYSLTSITIPNSVTSIGNKAFSNCKNLTSINIPSSVTRIGIEAFRYCDSLISINIPNSVTSIGDRVFSNCYNLTSIIVDVNNENYKSIDGNLYTKDGKTLIQYAIGKKDTSFIIPDGVTSIGDWAFYACRNLTSITIPNSVTSIGDWAFENCNKNLKIYLHPNVNMYRLGKKWHCGYPFFNSETKKPFTLGIAIRNLFKK